MSGYRSMLGGVITGSAIALIFNLVGHRWPWALLSIAIIIIAGQAIHIDTYRQFFRDLKRFKLPDTTAGTELERLRAAADEARGIARLLHDHLAGQGQAEVPDGLPMWIYQRPGYDGLDQAPAQTEVDR